MSHPRIAVGEKYITEFSISVLVWAMGSTVRELTVFLQSYNISDYLAWEISCLCLNIWIQIW